MKGNNTYYTVYMTTNMFSGKIYIGCHITNNLDDGYLGSGLYLIRAVNKYGTDSFKKEVLFCYDNETEMFKKEKEIVNEEFIIRDDNYNLNVGGKGGWNAKGFVTVKDEDGNSLKVKINDSRYLSGELVGITKGMSLIKDKDGCVFYVKKDDARILSGEFVLFHSDYVSVKGNDNKIFRLKKDDPRILSGELIHLNRNRICVRDKNGKSFWVENNDSRILSGELIHFRKNSVISKKTRNKISESLKKSVVGRCWITQQGKNKLVYSKDIEKFINDGWIAGRNCILIWINRNGVLKSVKPENLELYLKNGWVKGHNIDMTGSKNPAFNKKWMNNKIINKYVKPEEVDSFLLKGWVLGMLK